MHAVNPQLTLEPQNRDMALIRCPNCDTLHDLDGALFANGARKVRCANCRTVWSAEDPIQSRDPLAALPRLDSLRGMDEPLSGTRPVAPESADAVAPDANTADANTADAMTEGADISPEELEALFAEEAKTGPAAPQDPAPETATPESAPSPDEAPPFDPGSLARAQDAELDAKGEGAAAGRAERRARRLKATSAHHKPPARPSRMRPVAAMVAAAGFGTLATLVALRHETVRMVPETAALFEAFGLGVGARGLDIRDVHSRLMSEEGRETLEVTGSIVNPTKAPIKIPVLRLSIRNATGQDIYVWTATADQPELMPGEATSFRRRLASPPADAHAVMVRFVAKDDIVAAIR